MIVVHMSDVMNYFKGKKVTVMGLGLLGRGLGDALFLAECGAEVIVTDLKTAEQLEESATLLRPYRNVTLVLGEHRFEDFEGRDLILVAAGVRMDSVYLATAAAAGSRLTMSGALLAKLADRPVIGVTGTRGKSTVTHLINHTLQQVGVATILAGNVRGVSNLQRLKETEAAEVIVMELDSWQLQGFGWEGISPHIAVLTNLMPDHLNYYSNMEEYFADKANIYKFQRAGDALIAGRAVADEWIATHPAAYGLTIPEPLPADWQLLIAGDHNRENAAQARAALAAYGLKDEQIKQAFETFGGVEGRLQYVKNLNGVDIYNDNNATTPAATIAALQAIAKDKNVVLICGGTDKGIELDELVAAIKTHVKHLVLYSGSGTEVLKAALRGEVECEEFETLRECVVVALRAATPGDVLLFSPAFSSFGKEYKNEYDRNDQFLSLVKES